MQYTETNSREAKMPLRLRSIAIPLLVALAGAAPAFAQKKSGDAQPESAAQIETGKTSQSPTSKKKGGKSKSGASATATAAPSQEAFVEPDEWERPPADPEKPPPVAVKKQPEVVGDGKHISIAAVVGWGFLTDRKADRLGADPYRLELGVRGGYSFDSQLYLGAFYSYYIGETRSGKSAQTGLMTTASAYYMQFGAEVGYDWWVGPVVVRPSMQVGAALGFTTKLNSPSPIGSVMFGPGITIFKPIGTFFLGGDMRAVIVPGDGSSAFAVAVNGGLRF
jgi:hypothetical protein